MPRMATGGDIERTSAYEDPQYVILTSSMIRALDEEVNVWITRGWRPQGGISVIYMGIGDNKIQSFIQAMRKLTWLERFFERIGLL